MKGIMLMDRNIVIISSTDPFGGSNGKGAVIRGFLQYFKEISGNGKIFYIYVGANANDSTLSDIHGIKIHVAKIEKPNKIQRLKSVVFKSVLGKKLSIQQSLLYDKASINQVSELVNKISPNIILYDTLRSSIFRKGITAKANHVLYLDDLFSKRYRMMARHLENGESNIDPIGSYSRFIPRSLNRILKSGVIMRKVLLAEAKMVEKQENLLPHDFDMSLLINHEEAGELRERSNSDKIVSSPPFYHSVEEQSGNISIGKNFIFLGDISYTPNRIAVEDIINRIVPGLEASDADCSISIVGRIPDDFLAELKGCSSKFLEVLGFVDDISVVLRSARAMIMPISVGTGIKIKALDALSFGLPIISTTLGVNGLSVRHERECLIEDDIQLFPRAMGRLMDDGFRLQMSRNALETHKKYYSRDAIKAVYDRIFVEPMRESGV